MLLGLGFTDMFFCYPVTIYADAESALAFLRNREHEINLVIWDFHMPGTNGIQALKIICTEMDLPVLSMLIEDFSFFKLY